MVTATLRTRRGDALEVLDADGPQAFWMPAGSMSLAEFREWTYADDFPETGLVAYIGD